MSNPAPALRLVQSQPASTPNLTGKLPAHDLQSELDVLTGMLEDPKVIPVARGILAVDDFWHAGYRVICQAIFACEDMRTSSGMLDVVITPALVASWLNDRNLVMRVIAGEAPGPNAYGKLRQMLHEIAHERPVFGLSGFSRACRRVKDKARVRAAAETLWKCLAQAYGDHGDDAQKWLDETVAALREHANANTADDLRPIGADVASDLASFMSDADLAGITTGIRELDEHTGGFQSGDCWTITGAPGSGKTAFAIERAVETACMPDPDGVLRNGVLFQSMEMPRRQVMLRAACRQTLVDFGTAKNHPGQLDTEEVGRINEACAQLQQIPLYIDPRKGLNVEAIRGRGHRARSYFANKGLRFALLVVDYYQLLGAPANMQRGASRADELDVSGKQLIALAEELQVPLLLLAQLNKEGKIRDCSSLAMHTQNWLEIKTKKPADVKKGEPLPPAESSLRVRKQRNGAPEKTFACWFHGRVQRFSEDEVLR